MAPPLPPPGAPVLAGLAPQPIAWLPVSRLLITVHDTPILLSAPPFEHTPPVNVLCTMYTGTAGSCSNARMAAPPRSGPDGKQRLPVNREFTTLSSPLCA